MTLHFSLSYLIDINDIRVHIINYQTEGFYYQDNFNSPDFYTYDNQQLFSRLTLISGGSLHGSMEGSLSVWSSIPTVMRRIKNQAEIFELHTSLTDGFNYEKYNPAFYGQSQNYQQPIIEVGRFTGAGDLEIEFSGVGENGFVFDAVTVAESNMVDADSLTREIWTGHKIREMEAFAANTGDIQEIVELSKEERVLSAYTAFLALDLEQGAEPCFNCWDINSIIIVDTEELEEAPKDITIQTFPNPFTDFCTIMIESGDNDQSLSSISDARLEIHDRFGRLIYTKELDDLNTVASYKFVWDGTGNSGNKLPSGIYYLSVKTGKSVRTVTLSLLR